MGKSWHDPPGQAQYKNQEQPKFYCSACGSDRYCDCNAPALERLAAITEKSRQRDREKKQRQRERQKLNGNNDPSPGDNEDFQKDPEEKANEGHDDQPAEKPRQSALVGAWAKASSEVRREFVRQFWVEITQVRNQLDSNGAAQGDHEAPDRWIEGDSL
jgi:hypothetical protein